MNLNGCDIVVNQPIKLSQPKFPIGYYVFVKPRLCRNLLAHRGYIHLCHLQIQLKHMYTKYKSYILKPKDHHTKVLIINMVLPFGIVD